jgi:hypothetical protein
MGLDRGARVYRGARVVLLLHSLQVPEQVFTYDYIHFTGYELRYYRRARYSHQIRSSHIMRHCENLSHVLGIIMPVLLDIHLNIQTHACRGDAVIESVVHRSCRKGEDDPKAQHRSLSRLFYIQLQVVHTTCLRTLLTVIRLNQPSRCALQCSRSAGPLNQAFSLALCRSSFASFNKKLSRASATCFTQPDHNHDDSPVPPDRRANCSQMP